MDSINIKILKDGTIRVETDAVSDVNHLSAEQFLSEMSRLAGGKTEITQKEPDHGHSHGLGEGQHQHH